MTSTVNDHEVALREVMDQWKAAVDAHEPKRVAEYFTEDSIFQGLHPYSVGRRGIAEYYASQPLGMVATYRILESRQLNEDLVIGYFAVDFSFTDRAPIGVYLSILLARTAEGWRIAHYQVSRLDH